MELRRFNIATDIRLKHDATAQVIREAHIYLQSNARLKEVPFILCNGFSWSFGMASGKEKIKVTVIAQCYISTASGTNEIITRLIFVLLLYYYCSKLLYCYCSIIKLLFNYTLCVLNCSIKLLYH
jgi:hypothetical protein